MASPWRTPCAAALATLLTFLALLARPAGMAHALASTDTITSGGDNSRSGYQTNHNMDPAIVGSDQFGILWRAALPGNYRGYKEQVFSQTLVYTPGETQYVYVSTTMNYIHKINAKTGEIVKSRQVHVPFLTADLDGCVDINPLIGVTSTGVIDPASNTWYFLSKTYRDQSDVEKGRMNGRYFIHAVDAETLEEKPGFPVDLENTVARNNPLRWFQGGNAHQRTALLHQNGYIYAGFASHCVQYNFTGWIIGWDASGKVVEAFATQGGPEPTTVKGAGVWMSGGGLTSDGASSMWFATGNGYASQLHGTPVPGRQPPTALEEAAVHMTINADGTLKPIDFFMPFEKEALDGADQDLGTSPLVLLPNTFSCPNSRRMGIVTGKSGKSYFLNMDDLGGYCMGPNKGDAVPQVTPHQNSVYAGAGVYPLEGGYIYINVIQYPISVYKFGCNAAGSAVYTKVAQSRENNAFILGVGHGTTTSMNNEPGTGLYWVSDVQGANFRVYKAVPKDGFLELIKAINIPGSTKFMRPTFGDARAYVGTTQGFVYGLGSPVNAPLSCSSPYDFGTVPVGQTSAQRTVSCRANVNTQVSSIGLTSQANFAIADLPALPATVAAGSNISFKAAFKPSSPGPLSDDVYLNTTGGTGFARNTPVTLKGQGSSPEAVLKFNPLYISFEGLVTGANPGGVDQSIIFVNQGDAVLNVSEVVYSTAAASGPYTPAESTAAGPKVGPFTFKDLPRTIAGNSQSTVAINFNPDKSGSFFLYVVVRYNNGRSKSFQVAGTSGDAPKATLEFEAADGSGWVPYSNTSNFTFGSVYQSTTKNLLLRLTNSGGPNAASLSVTVSKPPVGGAIVGARNSFDLGEGTILRPGESANATVYCSVPKVQVNTPSYGAGATWTMNVNDLTLGKVFMQFECTAIAEQVGPLLGNGSAAYPYIGCAKENNPGRQLSNQLYSSADNTNDKCLKACANAGFIFAGTQYHRECWCGNTRPIAIMDDLQCNFNCAGNESQICGGNGYLQNGAHISLFADSSRYDPNGTVTGGGGSGGGGGGGGGGGPFVNPGNTQFQHLGCYKEAATGRTLPKLAMATDTLTVNNCLAACASSKFAGVEYGRECWCGDSLDQTLNTALTECNMACKGNATEFCGAGARLNVYGLRSGSATSTISSSSAPSSSTPPTSSSVLSSSTPPTSSLVLSSSTPPSSSSVPSSSTPPSSSSSSSSSAPTPTGPVVNPGVAGFTSVGCWTEATSGRALSNLVLADDTLTIAKCLTACSAYKYAGTEYARECWCGNTLASTSTQTVLTECNMKCAGNATEYCGAGNRLNLYTVGPAASTSSSATSSGVGTSSIPTSSMAGSSSIPTSSAAGSSSIPTSSAAATSSSAASSGAATSSIPSSSAAASSSIPSSSGASTSSKPASSGTATVATSSTTGSATPSVVPGNANYTSIGCYTEATGMRALSEKRFANDSMTVPACLTFCSAYEYSGVEYGRECYCGNKINSGSTSVALSQCRMLCAGDKLTYCGAGNRLNMYQKKPAEQPMMAAFRVAPLNAPAPSNVTQSTVNSVSSSGLSTASATTSSAATSATTSASASSASSAIISSAPVSGSASASSAATNTSTSASPTSTAWSYLGCANETNPRALSGASQTGDMTVKKCQDYCLEKKFPVAGLQGGDSCYCGSALQSNSTLGYDGCNQKCSGDGSQECGGVGRLSVFNYTLDFNPIVVPSVGSYLSQGCYSQPSSGQALSAYSFKNATNMTVEFCVEGCKVQGYGWAGVEDGDNCHCDRSLNNAATSSPMRDCSTKCAGDAREFCGGFGKLIIYHDQPTNMTESGLPKSGVTKTSKKRRV